ncbi:cytochrome [Xanthomonas translucens pv. graminis]|nr:cytochrome [Xanthomonas translucens pv. graminis]
MLSLSQMTMVVAILLRARTLHLTADARPALMPALVLRPLDVRIALRTRQTRAAGIPHADIATVRTVAFSPPPSS